MCGIAGTARRNGALTLEDVQVVNSMGALLAHRGPDSFDTWSDGPVAFTHRRLAIIDTSLGGAQPMTSESGRYVITFNGEIYNFRDLTARLRAEGWRNRSDSDTEVILAAVENWGLRRFLDLADGMFAFAMFDRQLRRLHLVRDPFGEKPLVYVERSGDIHFASEVRSLEVIPGLSLTVSERALSDYFRFGYVPGEQVIFEDVHRVPPATWIDFDLTANTPAVVTRYWEPESTQPSQTPRSFDELLELLDTSARVRTISDRPIGAFLSGGIDSALTCSLAARHVSGSLKTFTMGWEKAEFDESINAERVARALGADHHEVRLSRSDAVNEARSLGTVMDEPFADSSLLATRLVAAAARSKVVVALSGDGGDELFAGYNRHRWLLKASSAQHRVPGWLRKPASKALHLGAPALATILRPVPPSRRPRLVADKARKLAAVLAEDDSATAYQRILALIPSSGAPRVLPPEVLRAFSSANSSEQLWAVRVADLTGYMSDDVLTKVDRATMSVSLESRTPFLNRSLAEWALPQPHDRLIGKAGSKLPLRHALARLLPDVHFTQTKSGFGIPVADLLRHELAADLQDATSAFLRRGIDTAYDWPKAVQALRTGDDAPAQQLWMLLMFEYWSAHRERVLPMVT